MGYETYRATAGNEKNIKKNSILESTYRISGFSLQVLGIFPWAGSASGPFQRGVLPVQSAEMR
jgi:hypothetical protein